MTPLHGILHGHGPYLRYVYIYVYRPVISSDVEIVASMLSPHQELIHFPHQLSGARAAIGISSFTLATVLELI